MNDLIYISIFSLPWSEARPVLQADNAALIQTRRKMEQERINGQWSEIGGKKEGLHEICTVEDGFIMSNLRCL